MTTNEKQRVTLFLNPNLLKQAKAQAIVEETSLTALIARALAKYLPKETIVKKAENTID
ncbi:MAG TPA: CopG family transcriptional regulator [Patescibacteria group bacterium]